MDKYEYVVQKLQANNPDRATNRLNELGAQGWDVKFGMADGSSIVLILQRPREVVREAYKKAEAKKEADDKKKAAQDRMAKAREAKKAKAEARADGKTPEA